MNEVSDRQIHLPHPRKKQPLDYVLRSLVEAEQSLANINSLPSIRTVCNGDNALVSTAAYRYEKKEETSLCAGKKESMKYKGGHVT